MVRILLPATTPIAIAICHCPPTGKIDVAFDYLSSAWVGRITWAVLLGDFNIDLSMKGLPSAKKIKLFTNTHQIHQYISESTYVSKWSASIIDHIYSNSNIIADSGKICSNMSDRYPCYIVRKKAKMVTTHTTFTCHKLKFLENQFYENRLNECDWVTFMIKATQMMPGL